MKYITYVGSYTGEGHNDGIHIFESDAETGDFSSLGVINTFESPTYMALSKDCTRLYTVLGRPKFGKPGRNGGLAAFAVKGDKLELINEVATGYTIPCYVALSPDQKALVYAEYSCATAGFVDLNADGSIAKETLKQTQIIGEGPNKPRQDKAHAHCAIVTPDNKFELVVDLGIDQVKAYDFANRATVGMKEVPSATIKTTPAGAGPRHIVFHPNGKFAFVIFELTNLVSSYRYTGEGFELVDTKPLLSEKFTDFSKAAAIKISEDGSQVFCSNRGHNSITVFNFDAATGKLEFLNNSLLNGKFPRDFEFMPGGKFCLVGLKESWRVASYAYDRNSGVFTEVAKMEGIYRPLFFKFKK